MGARSPRRVLATAATCIVLLVAAGLAAAVPAAAAISRDAQMKQAILLLRGYIDRAGSRNNWTFPAKEVVRSGWENAPVWPADPWSGGALSSGSSRGRFDYRRSADRQSYRLIGYLSSGSYVVTGGMSDDVRLAYNHRTREGAVLLQQYIQLWANRHGGRYPPAAEVDRLGEVGEQPGMSFWPSNPWTHKPLSRGTKRACFEYVRKADAGAYTLTMHFDGGGELVLNGRAYADLRRHLKARLSLWETLLGHR